MVLSNSRWKKIAEVSRLVEAIYPSSVEPTSGLEYNHNPARGAELIGARPAANCAGQRDQGCEGIVFASHFGALVCVAEGKAVNSKATGFVPVAPGAITTDSLSVERSNPWPNDVPRW